MKKFSNVKIAGVSAPLYKALVIILAVVIAMGNYRSIWLELLSCWSF